MVLGGWHGVSGLIGLAMLVAMAVLGTAAVVTRDGSAGPQGVPAGASLADRVNGACGRFVLVDWTAGDEFDPLPPGLIQVTCSRGDGTLFYVAVAR